MSGAARSGADPSLSYIWTAGQSFKAGPIVTPGAFGAVGDGVTDDTAALQAMLDSGHTVWLKRGATYLTRTRLTVSTDGQNIYGNGATLKRRAQVVTTTATTITSGSTTQITVADASGLAVGDRIVLEKSGTYETSDHAITAINGSVVTLNTTAFASFSGTTNVRTSGQLLYITGKACAVRDLSLDGNKANWSWARWDHTAGIWLQGADNTLIEHCTVTNSPAEGILVNDTENARIAFCTLTNLNGNGIHFGGSVACNGGRVLYNHVKNVNLDTTVGHADGCIVLSNVVADFLIHGNRLDTTPRSGVGSINTVDNLDVTITDNEIRNCTIAAIEGYTSAGSSPVNVIIEGNRIYNSTQVRCDVSSGATAPLRWVIRGNTLIETVIALVGCQQTIVEGNTLLSTSSTIEQIQVTSVVGALIRGNQIIGGKSAVALNSGANKQILVSENYCANQFSFGIRNTGSGDVGVVVASNTISGDATVDAANYSAIRVAGTVVARDNTITAVQGANLVNVSGGSYAVVQGNTIRKGGANTTIAIQGSSSNTIVTDNNVSAAVSDGGVTTTAANNRTIV